MTRDEKRALFEAGVAALKRKGIADFPLADMELNGRFHHYLDSDTDSAWMGFLLGFHAGEKSGSAANQTTEEPK